MAWLPLLIVAVIVGTVQGQQTCPQGLQTSASTTITTNDVILIKAPLLTYADATNACACLGGGYTIANGSEFSIYRPGFNDQNQQATDGLNALVSSNLGNSATVWFGPANTFGSCRTYVVSPTSFLGGSNFADCQNKYAVLCSRSKKVFNPVGSACDNNLQLCQRGGYCNTASGKCETDTVCYPTNPCVTGLLGSGPNADTTNVYCTVAPGSFGGYTCECAIAQVVARPPNLPTCLQCPSANPCAVTRCPPGTSCDYECGPVFSYCSLPNGTKVPSVGSPPPPVATPPSTNPAGGDNGVCGSGENQGFPVRCWFNSDPQGRYVCCDSDGCNGFAAPDNLFPRCKTDGHVPAGYGANAAAPVTPPPSTPPTSASTPISGPQGVCGSGEAGRFPVRCYFNSDPQGRYVCCDSGGCNGFNPPDNLFPHCKADGYVPPGYGVNAAATTPQPASPPPPSGSQGVCGSGAAAAFPQRCYFNSDPQGRYVCCDSDGCNGFAPPDNLFPRCQKNGYAPPGYGI